jgi:Subtilase family
MPDRATGPWQNRVRFGPNGSFAYRPGEVLVNAEMAEQAQEELIGWQSDSDEGLEVELDDTVIADSYVRFTGNFETHQAIDRLHQRGILAQVNHVLFAAVCCPPHPSDPEAESFYAHPFYAHPFYAHPFNANPFYAHPFYAHTFDSCGCCKPSCSCSGASASPFYAHPFYAHPFYAHADTSPFANGAAQHSGARSSSARPAEAPKKPKRQAVGDVKVAILDTGWAESHTPTGLPKINVDPHGGDRPDEDKDGFLDPAAGHGTFIAGLIEQLAPGCELNVTEVLSTYGDGDEVEIAKALHALAKPDDDTRPPDLVNLSFGGYSPLGMGALTSAIKALHDAGTVVVAAAGNDATCLPMFPAVIDGVVGVGALDAKTNRAATFTNYGPWVRACSWGVDLVSLFFEGFNGAGPPEKNYDADDFQGWARWSGTSFATPMVVAALARVIGGGVSARAAVAQLIDDKSLPRLPMLGTIVDPTK